MLKELKFQKNIVRHRERSLAYYKFSLSIRYACNCDTGFDSITMYCL
jgi:hypothetical protein